MATESTYPAAIDAPIPAAYKGVFDETSFHNTGQGDRTMNAVIATQTALGVDPAGSYEDVAERLDAMTAGVSAAGAVAASATQTQVAATALTAKMNRVVTVASDGDAVKLPAATVGATIKVINAHLTNAVGVFPSSGDAINALSADAVFPVAATVTTEFNCAVAGIWNSK
jgi:hypothetical protein